MAKLYGVGIGPGDPELLTLKAIKIINESEVIVIPSKDIASSIAYKTIKLAIPEIDNKELLGIDMPMVKDENVLKSAHNDGALKIIEKLDKNKNVAFLTLGDPTIFSTFSYIKDIIEEKGYDTEIISGISSILSVGACINKCLVTKDETLHVIPSTYGVDEALKLKGTKIFMKAGNALRNIKAYLKNSNESIIFIENYAMEGERVIYGLENIPDTAGYFSIVIVSDGLADLK